MQEVVQVYDGSGSLIPTINQLASPDGRRVGLHILANGNRKDFVPEGMTNAFAVRFDANGKPCSHAWAWFREGGKGWNAGWRTGYGHCLTFTSTAKGNSAFVPWGWWCFEGVDGIISMGYLSKGWGRDDLWFDAVMVNGKLSRKANKWNRGNHAWGHNWTDTFQPSPEHGRHLAARIVGEDLVDAPFPPSPLDNPFIDIPDDVIIKSALLKSN